MWTDEMFEEIQKGDKVFYETAQGQTRSGKAKIIGPMGWVIELSGGTPVVVNEGFNYLGHTEGKDREPDHFGHFLNGQVIEILPTSGLTDMVETVSGSTM